MLALCLLLLLCPNDKTYLTCEDRVPTVFVVWLVEDLLVTPYFGCHYEDPVPTPFIECP